jgi:hypothetical protein
MKSILQSAVRSTLFILILSMSSSASGQTFSSVSVEEMPSLSGKTAEACEPLADLFLQLMTRPGVTDSSDIRTLHFAAHGAALSFRQSMFRDPGRILKWLHFRKDVGLLVDTYQKEYALATEGIAGAEAKGAALDHLLDGLLEASVHSGISLEEFDAALLRGAATVEAMISDRPLSKKLSLTDRELVIFLLRYSVHQERRRILLDSTRDAMLRLNAAAEIRAPYQSRIYAVLRPTLKRELIGLERTLADPIFVSDPQKIITAGYNLEAICDVFAMKYALELYSLAEGMQETLISSLAAQIPGMTPEILQEQLHVPITALAAYVSLNPALPLTYHPISGLADRLAVIGVTPPTPPDFSLFPDPYRALIRMGYDIRLCDLITGREWSMAQNEIQDLQRPLSLGEQMIVKEAALKRLSQVRSHIKGVSEDTAEALLTLHQSVHPLRI